jgi:ABC-2 type transport system ATP-binding protein
MKTVAAGASRPVVDVAGLSKSFAGRSRATVDAVRDLSFSVDAGERLAFIGPNGAGKSTSIKMLTGILHPTSGTARVLGFVPWQQRRALAARTGTLFGQRSLLWFELSPRQSLRMLAAIYGLDRRQEQRRVDELGALLDATDLLDVPVRDLSLGQRMRCELTACLLHEPDILFLDEPTIGLDLLAKRRLRELLVTLNEVSGTTVFLTSHDVADIEHVAERVIVISSGTVIYDDTVAVMRRTLLSTKLVEVGLGRPADILEFDGVTVLAQTGTSIRLSVDTGRTSIRDVLGAVLDRYVVSDISVVDPPLEQVIGEIYARQLS